jgi:hypothetical protein
MSIAIDVIDPASNGHEKSDRAMTGRLSGRWHGTVAGDTHSPSA